MTGLPLHMQRAEAVLRASRRHLDLWIEVADARAPLSSRLPRLRRLLAGVEALLVLTHADAADPRAVEGWRSSLPPPCFALNAREALPRAFVQEIRRRTERPPLRLFVAGLPNVGKSTLINRLVGERAAPVGAKAGVTRAEQWLRRGDLALLDLPGILPPELPPAAAALGLAPEAAYDAEAAALWLLQALPAAAERYGVPPGDADALGSVAAKAHLVRRGAEPDRRRAARLVLQDLRRGRIRPAQLEWPPDA